MFFSVHLLKLIVLSLMVSTSVIDCMERLISENQVLFEHTDHFLLFNMYVYRKFQRIIHYMNSYVLLLKFITIKSLLKILSVGHRSQKVSCKSRTFGRQKKRIKKHFVT